MTSAQLDRQAGIGARLTRYTPPSLVFGGQVWAANQLAGMAATWYRELLSTPRHPGGPLAMVMVNHPHSVALFFALSCFPVPLILLPLDLKPWRTAPPLPPETHLVLSPPLAHLEAEARGLGVSVTVLSDPESSGDERAVPPFMTTPGFVLFTSGSTGLSRPVYRTTVAVLDGVRASLVRLGAQRGGGVIATLPLARAFGFNHGLMAAVVLEASLALVPRFDHGTLLRLFATRAYHYWSGTPMMGDVLGRCPAPDRHVAPPLCIIGGRVSKEVARRFTERFGVPLRSLYGTTETGTISVDSAPAAEVCSISAGLPLPEVDLRVGDDPRRPFAAGTVGRIWLASPRYLMKGYGFPPDLEPPETVDGWWGTPDVGQLDRAGRVTIVGRLDDCIRTEAGHVVNPEAVTLALENYPGVTDLVVVPLATADGPMIGVLVEGAGSLNSAVLRTHLWRSLPSWAQPRVLETTAALPRLPSGRVDRKACIALLAQSLDRGVRS